jgi:hypothetical protein
VHFGGETAEGASGEEQLSVSSDLVYDVRSGAGYDAEELASYLETYPGLINDKEAVLVGAGNLGRALAIPVYAASVAGSATGSVKQKVEPAPGLLSAHTRPPCASTSCFTMASPRPAPPVARVRDLSTR